MTDAAIVGLGRWGRTLVDAVQGKSEKLRFTHLVSRDPGRVRDFASTNGLTLLPNLETALGTAAVEAVVLATPHSQHLDQVLATAAAGKHVFCEKPLALTKGDAVRATEACREAGVTLGLGTDKRFFPAMQELARIARDGSLGKLLHLEANFSNEVAATMFTPWREAPGESPAGGLTGTAIHVLDAMIRMGGPVRRVRAQLLSHKPPPDPQDSLSALIEFASGISGTLAAVRSTPAYWRVHVFGRDGSAEALGRTELVLRKSGTDPQHLRLPPVDSVRANLEAFADAVEGRALYPIPDEDTIALVSACEAIIASAEYGGHTVEA